MAKGPFQFLRRNHFLAQNSWCHQYIGEKMIHTMKLCINNVLAIEKYFLFYSDWCNNYRRFFRRVLRLFERHWFSWMVGSSYSKEVHLKHSNLAQLPSKNQHRIEMFDRNCEYRFNHFQDSWKRKCVLNEILIIYLLNLATTKTKIVVSFLDCFLMCNGKCFPAKI